MRRFKLAIILLFFAVTSACTCYHTSGTNYAAKCADRPDYRQSEIHSSNTYGIAREYSCCSDFPVTFRNYENCEDRYQRYEWIFQPRMAFPCTSNVVCP